MVPLGTENMSAYLCKMAIDRYVVNLDMPELRKLTFKKSKRIKRKFTKSLKNPAFSFSSEVRSSYALRELVKAVYVEAPDQFSEKRTQAIYRV